MLALSPAFTTGTGTGQPEGIMTGGVLALGHDDWDAELLASTAEWYLNLDHSDDRAASGRQRRAAAMPSRIRRDRGTSGRLTA
jgi:hypothetical protein